MAKGVKAAAKTVGKSKAGVVANEVEVVPAEVVRQRKRLMKPAGCRTYMRNELAKEFPEIVNGFVKEAKKGSCPHVKQTMEILAKPVRKGTPRRKGTAARLLEELSRGREAE